MSRESDTNIGLAKKRVRDRFRDRRDAGLLTNGEYECVRWAMNELASEFEQIEGVKAAVLLAVMDEIFRSEGKALKLSA